ncbi:ATP-binding protein [Actinacidiphila acididurans]|uniref:histidine kinase n=1 Tax=Actinacidiphila acididurans TaxID=2784346 RepID=A0ABS2U119_9ACTN|nr:ATP-binding protein [Actinacidiphila acididurans]MBM9509298.1 ATP-binding protein [Actinacidiphila acididurans]
MTRHIPEAVFWCVAAVALAGLVLSLRQYRAAAALRRRLAAAEKTLRGRDAEVRHLVEVRLTALEENHWAGGQPLPGLLDGGLFGTDFARSLQQVVDRFTGAAETARTRADHSAKATLKAAMRALQALANEQQLSISDMQDRHDSPHVLQDLLEIDHANSQFGRRAQAIAVLCGSWPGRQRAASPLIDVVRGATSRIRDYRRVEIHSAADIDVTSRAVEPVVLAVAELLDNAARHSQPNTSVEVNIRSAHNGVSVVIDDAGVGMDSGEIEEAGRRLSGTEDIDINRLGDPPQFGFAVIGVLAARYGFTVSVDSRSPYGGVRAVVFLPKSLLATAGSTVTAPVRGARTPAPGGGTRTATLPTRGTHVLPAAPDTPPAGLLADPAQTVPAGPAALTDTTSPADAPAQDAPDHEDEGSPAAATAGGLPRRRRRTPTEAATAQTAPDPADDEPATATRPAYETATRMGAFARGTRSGRAATADDEGIPQE